MFNPDNIFIVLLRTRQPGNIGAVARSMMNFGLKNMILVDPHCRFNDETYVRARHAAPIFENAQIADSLEEVAGRFQLLLGTSRRGAFRLHMRMTPRLAAQEIHQNYALVKTGFLFGDEKSGLTNEDLEKCSWYVNIPVHPDFPSLNLAHSVTIVAYELFQAFREDGEDLYKSQARQKQVEYLSRHIRRFLDEEGFPSRGSADRVNCDIRRMLASADLKKTDVTLLHGLMRYLEEKHLGGWLSY